MLHNYDEGKVFTSALTTSCSRPRSSRSTAHEKLRRPRPQSAESLNCPERRCVRVAHRETSLTGRTRVLPWLLPCLSLALSLVWTSFPRKRFCFNNWGMQSMQEGASQESFQHSCCPALLSAPSLCKRKSVASVPPPQARCSKVRASRPIWRSSDHILSNAPAEAPELQSGLRMPQSRHAAYGNKDLVKAHKPLVA